MIRFNSIKWLPKTPIIALAVLALAALAGGGVHRAEAQTPTPQQYTVELSFDTITFPVINDCEFILHGCSNADVYGTINGRTTSTGVGAQGARNLGTWENKANCNSTVAYGWASFGSGELPCAKFVEQGKTYNFADAPLCTSYTHLLCTGPYQRNNNKIRLTVKPGEQIR